MLAYNLSHQDAKYLNMRAKNDTCADSLLQYRSISLYNLLYFGRNCMDKWLVDLYYSN